MRVDSNKTFFAVVLMASTALLLPGCRIGNRVVKAADPTAMSGFYKTEAQAMTVCAFVSGQSPQCAATDLAMIPTSITSVMTDPVYVAANTFTAKAYLVPNSLDTNSVFEMKLTPSGAIEAEPYVSEAKPLWTDPACLSQVQIQKEGEILSYGGAGKPIQNNFEISVSVCFSLGVLTALGTQCAPNLQEMRNCYSDVNQCPGATPQDRQDEQSAVQNFINPYLSKGVLTLDDLPQLQGFGWEVSYQ